MAIKKDGKILSHKEAKKTLKEIPKKSTRIGEPYHLIGPKEEGFPLWVGEIIYDDGILVKAKLECRYEGRRGETKIITI